MFNRSVPVLLAFLLAWTLTACGPSTTDLQTATAKVEQSINTSVAQTLTAEPTETPLPTSTSTPTATPTQTATIPPTATNTAPPTATLPPQLVSLRKTCGTSYTVMAGQPVMLLYGGWAVSTLELAQQWTSVLTVDLTIDGKLVKGYQQPPTQNRPFTCGSFTSGLYYLYYIAVIPELTPGQHNVKVTMKANNALSDGAGMYGPGILSEQSYVITSK